MTRDPSDDTSERRDGDDAASHGNESADSTNDTVDDDVNAYAHTEVHDVPDEVRRTYDREIGEGGSDTGIPIDVDLGDDDDAEPGYSRRDTLVDPAMEPTGTVDIPARIREESDRTEVSAEAVTEPVDVPSPVRASDMDPASFADTIAPSGDEPGATRAGRPGGAHDTLAARAPYDSDDVLLTIDEYDVLEVAGEGGMGVVYKAWSRRLGRFVAIKSIRGDYASDVLATRFINEAMIAARLQHPNIVAIHASGETDDGAQYFVMEYIEGRDLGEYLDEGLTAETDDGGLTRREAIEVLEKAARAVHYAHTEGVVHRDIKPDNILIDDANGEPHLTDFGVAKAVLDDAGLTTAGEVMGTPHYMSPEQANGEIAAIGPRSDVYSLGATLYHVITGHTMFPDDTGMSVLFKVLREEPPPPSSALSSGLPPIPIDLETICLKAIEKEAVRRYESAEAFADELRRYLDDEPIEARPISTFEKLRRRLMRNRKLVVAVFIAVALLITTMAAFGVTLVDNVERTSDSIRELDRTQALGQAATLERAITVNMLQGRADLARDLVNGLRESPEVGSIQVARLDGRPAYTDATTLRKVQARLSQPGYLDDVAEDHPELMDEIEEAAERAVPNIEARLAERNEQDPTPIEVDDEAWRSAALGGETMTYEDEASNELVVLEPIFNREECTVCHGDDDAFGYGRVRAVLIVRRPLDRVQDLVAENTRTTWTVGIVTVVVLLGLVFLTARLFGIGVQSRRYGAGRREAT